MLELVHGDAGGLGRDLLGRLDLLARDPRGGRVVVSARRAAHLHCLKGSIVHALGGIWNVHFLSLTELAEEILRDGAPPAPPLPPEWLLEELLRGLSPAIRSTDPPLADLLETRGGPPLLRAALRTLRSEGRDLKSLRPARAKGKTRGKTDRSRLLLDRLARAAEPFYARLEGAGLLDPVDLPRAAAERVAASNRVRGEKALFLYDPGSPTEGEGALVEAIARVVPVRVYLLASGGRKAHAEGRAALERWRGLAKEAVVEPLPPAEPRWTDFLYEDGTAASPPPGGPDLTVVRAHGREGEAWAAAKLALEWVEQRGFAPEEVAIVAPDLEPYRTLLRRAFEAQGMPAWSCEPRRALDPPPLRAVRKLLSLPAHRYERGRVLEVVESPYFSPEAVGGARLRVGLVDRLTRLMGVRAGLAEWDRIITAPEDLLPRKDGPRLAALIAWVHDVEEAFGTQGRDASWSDRAAAAEKALRRFLRIDPLPEGMDDPESRSAVRAFLEALRSLPLLDRLGVPSPAGSLAPLLVRMLEALRIEGGGGSRGVRLLSAVEAAGLTFRGSILLGLDAGDFQAPRGENPFLPPEERTSSPPEAFLSAALASGAKEALALVSQREDEEGSEVLPPSLVEEALGLRPAGEPPGARLLDVPRSVVRRLYRSEGGVSVDLAAPGEWIVGETALRREIPPEVAALVPSGPLLLRSLRVAHKVSDWKLPPGDHDGKVGDMPWFWSGAASEGIRPPFLEAAAQCPFRAWASGVMGFRPALWPEEESVLPDRDGVAKIVRDVLLRYHRGLLEAKADPRTLAPPEREGRAVDALRASLGDLRERSAHRLPFAWRAFERILRAPLVEAVAEDARELVDSGFVPVAVGTWGTADLDGEGSRLPKAWASFDRVDLRPGAPPLARATTWVVSESSEVPAEGLEAAAMRLKRLEAPFQLLALGRANGVPPRSRPESSRIVVIAPRSGRVWNPLPPLTAAFWKGAAGEATRVALTAFLDRLRQGFFPLRPRERPGGWCGGCSFENLCRKGYGPSRARAAASDFVRELDAWDRAGEGVS